MLKLDSLSLSLSLKMLGEAFGVLGKRVGVEGATNANRGVRPLVSYVDDP